MLLNVYQNKTFYRVWTPVSAYAHRNLLTLINCLLERHNVFNTVHEKKQHSNESIHFKFWFLYLASSVLLLLRHFFYPIQDISLYFSVLYVNILLLLIIPKSNHVIYLDFSAFTFFSESEIIGTRYLCDATDYNCLTISTHK